MRIYISLNKYVYIYICIGNQIYGCIFFLRQYDVRLTIYVYVYIIMLRSISLFIYIYRSLSLSLDIYVYVYIRMYIMHLHLFQVYHLYHSMHTSIVRATLRMREPGPHTRDINDVHTILRMCGADQNHLPYTVR